MLFTYCCATLLTVARLESGVLAGRIDVQVVAADALRQTSTGKIQKFLMREAVEQRLGLKAAKTA